MLDEAVPDSFEFEQSDDIALDFCFEIALLALRPGQTEPCR